MKKKKSALASKDVTQTETQSYFQDIWKKESEKEILIKLDEVVKKVGKRKVTDWDKA